MTSAPDSRTAEGMRRVATGAIGWLGVVVTAAACSGGSPVVGGDAASDLGPADPGPTDTRPTDTGPADAGPADAGPADIGPADSGPADAGLDDGGPSDTSPEDVPAPDASPTDGGPGDVGCAAGESSCASDGGTLCAALDRDPAHCGACGVACTGGALCTAGVCGCAAGEARCGERCVDTSVDREQCGACGMACAPQAFCAQGRCQCGGGLTLCETRCIDVRSDNDHCGACGTSCGTVGVGARCVAGRCGAESCGAVLRANPGATDGVYLLDLDGPGPGPARGYYCDMAGGGWTLVANQVPEAPLPDTAETVNPAGIGTLAQSYRLGGAEITAIRPALAWRLTDATNSVFFTPACTVDWHINYTAIMTPTPCTVGYTSTAFTSVFNGRWVYCSAKGIGINNSGQFCSMRMHEGGPSSQGAMAHGRAATCLYRIDQRVSLWFR